MKSQPWNHFSQKSCSHSRQRHRRKSQHSWRLGENKTLPLKGPSKPFESQKAGKILSDFIANKIFMQNISAALVKSEFRFVVVWQAIVHASEIYFDFFTRVESVFPGQCPWKHTHGECLFDDGGKMFSAVWTMASRTIIHLSPCSALLRLWHGRFPRRKTQAGVSEMARNQFSPLIKNRWFRST